MGCGCGKGAKSYRRADGTKRSTVKRSTTSASPGVKRTRRVIKRKQRSWARA